MAHINDLDIDVLYRILYFASGPPAKDIDVWKLKLPLLQVCTKWYELFKSNVFSQGFVDIHSLDSRYSSTVDLNSCIYYAKDDIVCRSNLGIITGRDEYNCDCVSKLKVKTGHSLHISQYGHILKDISALGVGYWLNLSSLVFTGGLASLAASKFTTINLDGLLVTISKQIQDFQSKAPNIAHLELNAWRDSVLLSAFNIFIDHYASCLQSLDFDHPIESPLPPFSTELASLSLDLSDYTHRHSSFHAKSLQYLRLHNMSNKKSSWWIFHDFTTPGFIEFTNLKTLVLTYTNVTNEEMELSYKHSKQTRPYGSHMLRLPKLESLTLQDFPMDCDVFFTDTIPTHLKELNISGFPLSVIATGRLRFERVNKMYIDVSGATAPVDDLHKVLDRYFGYTTIGSSCVAHFTSPVDTTRTVSWVNITNLTVDDTGFDGVLELIANIYNLRSISVSKILFIDESMSIIQSGLEEEEQGDFELLDTRIEKLRIHSYETENPYHYLVFFNHLLLRTTTLRDIGVYGFLYSYVADSFLPEKFPHVNFSLS